MRRVVLTVAVAVLVVIAGCSGAGTDADGGDGVQADGAADGADGGASGGGDGGEVGVSVGGAQDANAFRRNVREGYVPQPTDLTYEGLFHDYYFDTAAERDCERAFCPSYSKAVTRDPLSNETERFVTVGLNSGLTETDVGNRSVNLVFVVDTSGSMSDRFDEYYYDGDERKEVADNQRKMDAASEAIASMIDRLDGEDRVGVVEYDDEASVVNGMDRVDETDAGELRSAVRGLDADGGTNLDSGMRVGHDVAAEYADEDRETRIVYVTDAMPNLGRTGGDALRQRIESHAEEGVHSTFVGVGVDFNSELTEAIATVRGANYYAVHSPGQFEERMADGFEYMTSPLAHNLTLRVDAEGYEIETVYGSPQADRTGGELMHVETLFPSRKEGNRSEGGVVLLELDRTGEDPTLGLEASYEDPGGEFHRSVRNVTVAEHDPPYYGSTGVRKAVALSEYANLLRNWMAHERALESGDDLEAPGRREGIDRREYDSRWEQGSLDLRVSEPYGERVEAFVPYFRDQMEVLGADRMDRDLGILQRLTGIERTEADASADTTGRDGESDTNGGGAATTPDGGDATEDGAALALGGSLGGNWPLLGLVNLVVTLFVAVYGVRRKRRVRGREGVDARADDRYGGREGRR